jgi:hypothetical protein
VSQVFYKIGSFKLQGRYHCYSQPSLQETRWLQAHGTIYIVIGLVFPQGGYSSPLTTLGSQCPGSRYNHIERGPTLYAQEAPSIRGVQRTRPPVPVNCDSRKSRQSTLPATPKLTRHTARTAVFPACHLSFQRRKSISLGQCLSTVR